MIPFVLLFSAMIYCSGTFKLNRHSQTKYQVTLPFKTHKWMALSHWNVHLHTEIPLNSKIFTFFFQWVWFILFLSLCYHRFSAEGALNLTMFAQVSVFLNHHAAIQIHISMCVWFGPQTSRNWMRTDKYRLYSNARCVTISSVFFVCSECITLEESRLVRAGMHYTSSLTIAFRSPVYSFLIFRVMFVSMTVCPVLRIRQYFDSTNTAVICVHIFIKWPHFMCYNVRLFHRNK